MLNKNLDINTFGTDTISIVSAINKYILEHDCPKLSMDISHLNLFDASKITILCSTYHWAKYPEGQISWKTSSLEIKDLIKPLNLGNINLITE